MAIYREDILDVELKSGSVNRSFLNHTIGQSDDCANRFGVRLVRDSAAVDLTGCTCEGFFLSSHGDHIVISGSTYTGISGNVAYVDLPQICYDYEGQFCLVIKVIGGGVTGTMRIIDGMVCNTYTDNPVTVPESVPTYQEILAAYDEMLEATEAANDAAEAAEAAAESITGELAVLYSFDAPGNIMTEYSILNGFLDASGAFVSNESYRVTDYIPIDSSESLYLCGRFPALTDSYYNVWAYTIGMTAIEGIYQASDNNAHTVKLEFPENTRFIRIVSSATLINYSGLYYGGDAVTSALDNAKKANRETKSVGLLEGITFSAGFLSADGSFVSNDAWRTTDYVPVFNDGGKIYITGILSAVEAVLGSVWAYNSNKRAIKILFASNETKERTLPLELTPEVRYIRIVTSIRFYKTLGVFYGADNTTKLIKNAWDQQNTTGAITTDNKKLFNLYDVPVSRSSGIYITNGKLTQNHTGSGSKWWEIEVKISELTDNVVELVADFETLSGTARLYVFGKNSQGAANFITVEDFTTAGRHDWILDLNNYSVYNNLSLSYPVSVGIANISDEFSAVYTVLDAFDYVLTEGTGVSFNKTLTNIQKAVDAVASNDTPDVIVAPNGSKYFLTVGNNGTLAANSIIPTGKVLFMGNSLTAVWGFGMAASDADHDWVYYVKEKLTELNSGLSYDRVFSTGFEECSTEAAAQAWMQNTLDRRLTNNVSVVFIQLGDNIAVANDELFRTTSRELIQFIRNKLPGCRVVWIGCWYDRGTNTKIAQEACAAAGATFVNITALNTKENQSAIGNVVHRSGTQTETYTITSYTDDTTNHELTINFTINNVNYTSVVPYTSYTTSGDTITIVGEYTVITQAGVASHPGNKGFLDIANKVLFKCGYTDTSVEMEMNE